MESRYDPPSSTLRSKLRSSASCLSCCFGNSATSDDDPGSQRPAASLIRTSSTWIKSKAQELPEVKNRFVNRMKHRRAASGGFQYDSLNYALNFDEGGDEDVAGDDGGGGFRYRNFSSRLPSSPPPPATHTVV